MFKDGADLVLEVGLDGDLQTVRDALAVFPHVVNQQMAEGCHTVADWEAEIRHTAVHLSLGGRPCNPRRMVKGGGTVFMKTI